MANSSYPQEKRGMPADERALIREYAKRVRHDPNFKPAMELVRRFGRIAIGELEHKWAREVKAMYE